MRQNIHNQVVCHALCTACGACAGICSRQAISLRENAGGFLVATVDTERCINCGQCLNYCPSIATNQRIENLHMALHGTALAGFIGHAQEKRIRFEGQSGGIVTALLLYLLENRKIDGAITNQFDGQSQRSKAVYVDTKYGLLDSCGSYYTQSAVVKETLEHTDKRLAAVVLGCQSRAIKLLELQGRKTPEYLIGLICAGQNSGHMIDDLIKQTHCPYTETPKKFRFRYSHPAYGAWPGNILLVTDKQRYILNKSCRHAIKPLYEAYRCILCYDQMCVGADLVCGDPWGISGDHSTGETVVIVRTEKGLSLLKDAEAAGYVLVEELAVEQINVGETVDTQHLLKMASGFSICKEKKWEYPFLFSPAIEKELKKIVSQKERLLYLKRLLYTRKRGLTQTADDAAALKKIYEQACAKTEKYQKWHLRLFFPIRCVRYVLRKLGNKI